MTLERVEFQEQIKEEFRVMYEDWAINYDKVCMQNV